MDITTWLQVGLGGAVTLVCGLLVFVRGGKGQRSTDLAVSLADARELEKDLRAVIQAKDEKITQLVAARNTAQQGKETADRQLREARENYDLRVRVLGEELRDKDELIDDLVPLAGWFEKRSPPPPEIGWRVQQELDKREAAARDA